MRLVTNILSGLKIKQSDKIFFMLKKNLITLTLHCARLNLRNNIVWLYNVFLSTAGADKKAEAGAGSATEFQFVSILNFVYLLWQIDNGLQKISSNFFYLMSPRMLKCSFLWFWCKTLILNLKPCVTEGWLWTRQRTAASVNLTVYY